MTADAVFVPAGQRFVATELGRGPWDPGALHGGAPAALLVHAFTDLVSEPELQLARITYEFVRPVPLGELEVRAEVLRPGRRVTLLEGSLYDAEGTLVTRARALMVRPAEDGPTESAPPPFPGPADGSPNDFFDQQTPMFASHAMEIRFVEGRFHEPGPATAWFRLRHPLLAGEPLRPFERAAAAADFGNGISSVVSWEEFVFINPDLTVYLEREPRGEWVAVQAQTRVRPGDVAMAESVLWDETGRIGHASQALLVARR